MNPLAAYLEKFKTLLNSSTEKRRIIAAAISDYIKIDLPQESIEIKSNGIYISGTPTMKSELLIHSRKIKEELEKALHTPVVIR